MLSAGGFFQQWCPAAERIDIAVDLECFVGEAYRGYNGIDDIARELGLPDRFAVSGVEPKYLDLLQGDPQFSAMAETVVSRACGNFADQQTVLCVVWCKRGKHRSVGLADG